MVGKLLETLRRCPSGEDLSAALPPARCNRAFNDLHQYKILNRESPMIIKASPDIAMFLSGKDGSTDADVARMAGWYVRASSLADARYWCYAIIGHGTPGTIAATHIADAIQKVEQAYNQHGDGRVLLVLSCALGYGSARTIATWLKVNVIAARTTIMMSDSGHISLKPESEPITIGAIRMPPRRDWIYVKPDGTMTLSSLKTLDLGGAGEFFDL